MSDSRAIGVRVPASSANLGAGFDAMALALRLYLTCTMRETGKGLSVRVTGEERGGIAVDETNLVWRAFLRLCGERGPGGVELEIANDIPLSRGLGSSAAAIVAGLALANEWAQLGKTREELVQVATEIEGHPDNVAAATWGGFVVSCQSEDGWVVSAKQKWGQGVQVVVVIPEFELATAAARAALPAQVSRRDAVFNVQRAALLVAALAEGKADFIGEAMRDRLHQPYRAPLIPGLKEILELRGVPGLLGVALSGAGPSVLAFCSSHPDEVGAAIVERFGAKQINARARVLPVDEDGVVVQRMAD
jgi:homoserine kinase